MMIDVINDISKQLSRDLNFKEGQLIKDALLKNGFSDVSMEFLADNFEFVYFPNDTYKHLYYKYGTNEAKRIISIQNNPEVENNFDSFENNKVKMTATIHYY